MSTLHVSFAINPGPSGSATVPVEVIDGRLRRVWHEPLALAGYASIEVPAGQYLVRAYLPSGELVATQVTVTEVEGGQARLAPERPSPRENLTYAYLLRPAAVGGEGTPGAVVRTVAPTGVTAGEEVSFDLEGGLEVGEVERVPAPVPVRPWLRFWQCQPAPDLSGEAVRTRWTGLPVPDGVQVDPTVARDDPRALAEIQLRLPPGIFWLQVGGANVPSKLVALPGSEAGVPTRVLLSRGPAVDADLATIDVAVSGQDSRAVGLLGYLTDGAFGAARLVGEQLVRDAEQMLFAKLRDPTSAAIGGYYLLQAGRLDRLHTWTANLARWFPWLPDGAVIHAWHLLRRDPPDVALARGRLLEAVGRGLPLYTTGLRLLFDGLRILARQAVEEDRALVAALAWVEPYAIAADWRTPTTTFSGRDPSAPSPSAPHGPPPDGAPVLRLPEPPAPAGEPPAVEAGEPETEQDETAQRTTSEQRRQDALALAALHLRLSRIARDPRTAEARLLDAAAIYRRLGLHQEAADEEARVGRRALRRGELERAERLLRQACETYAELELAEPLAEAELHLAEIAARRASEPGPP